MYSARCEVRSRGSVADIADFWDAWGASARRARLRVQLGPDGFEEPTAHRAVIAWERDHEAHTPMPRSVGIARQGPDAGKGAGLEVGAVAAAEQGGMGLEQVQQLGKAVGREVVAAADARALLELDGLGEAVPDEHLVRDLERLLEADGAAQAMPADLQEDLVRDVVIRVEGRSTTSVGKSRALWTS